MKKPDITNFLDDIEKQIEALQGQSAALDKEYAAKIKECGDDSDKVLELSNEHLEKEQQLFLKRNELREHGEKMLLQERLSHGVDNLVKCVKDDIYNYMKKRKALYDAFGNYKNFLSAKENISIKLNLFDYSDEELYKSINTTFKTSLQYLKEEKAKEFIEIERFITNIIKAKEQIVYEKAEDPASEAVKYEAQKTRYPQQFIMPIDKISALAFNGELNGRDMKELAMERRGSKKQITAFASIDFENLENNIKIKGRRELTAYDREVHDAITTLHIDGGNEYITPQMIYQTMTGNPKAFLNPKQAEAISESMTKCMYSRVQINAKDEAEKYHFDFCKYDGPLIAAERKIVSLNGKVLECMHILRPPILYGYANEKNQIGRVDLKLLNSPINKTEESITIQGYLTRRVLSMKGRSSLSRTIVYETVYNQINIEASTDGALRKKKKKIREQIKRILDYWIKQDFIKGYTENKRKAEIYSITIDV